MLIYFVDFGVNDDQAEETMNIFRLLLGFVNTFLLASLIYSRTALIVKSYSNHMLVRSLIDDFESRIKLQQNVHTCTEFVHILNKMFLQAHFPNDLCVPSTFVVLFFSAVA